jgi:hypothetical protein
MQTRPILFDIFQSNVLRFIDRCGVAAGVVDMAAWNAVISILKIDFHLYLTT